MILGREPRSLTTQMRMVKVRSLRYQDWRGNGSVLDFVDTAAFSMEGQK
jgi:hypothetical protein